MTIIISVMNIQLEETNVIATANSTVASDSGVDQRPIVA